MLGRYSNLVGRYSNLLGRKGLNGDGKGREEAGWGSVLGRGEGGGMGMGRDCDSI